MPTYFIINRFFFSNVHTYPYNIEYLSFRYIKFWIFFVKILNMRDTRYYVFDDIAYLKYLLFRNS